MITDMNQMLKKMVDDLKTAGENCGYMSDGNVVWIRGPGEPYSDHPTSFSVEDLAAAVKAGLLRKQLMLSEKGWTYYVLT